MVNERKKWKKGRIKQEIPIFPMEWCVCIAFIHLEIPVHTFNVACDLNAACCYCKSKERRAKNHTQKPKNSIANRNSIELCSAFDGVCSLFLLLLCHTQYSYVYPVSIQCF